MTNKDNNREYRENRGPRKAPQDDYNEYNEYNESNEYNDYNDNNYNDNYDDSYDDNYDNNDRDDNDDGYDDDYDDNYDDGYDAGYAPRRARGYDDGYDDYDDGYDDGYGYQRPAKPVNSKPIIFGIIAIAIIALAIIFIPKIIKSLKPDAVISTADMDIQTSVIGFDGHAVITGELVGEPTITEIKDQFNKSAYKNIYSNIVYSDVTFDKSDNLKNGDTVIAKVTLSCPLFKVKFDRDTIEKEIPISKLPTLVNSIKDLPDDFVKKFDKKAKQFIIDNLNRDYKNIKIEKVALMEKVMEDEDIKSMISDGRDVSEYQILSLFKVNYDIPASWFTSASREVRFFAVRAFDFRENNNKVECEYKTEIFKKTYDDVINTLGFEGFDLITSKSAGEPDKKDDTDKDEKDTQDDTDDKDDKEEKDDEDDQNDAKEEANDIGKTFYVNNQGNLREDHSLSAGVIIKLADGAEVTVNDEVHTDDGRTWYLVDAIDIDGAYYSGWISSRVLR